MTNRLREFREAAGLSQDELADRVGSSFQQISKLERGERKLTREWAERLAPHIKTTWWLLLGAPTTGLAEPSASIAPPASAPTLSPITEIAPEEDDGYDTLLSAAEDLIEQEGAHLTPREFAQLARTLWREVQDEGADTPLLVRIAAAIERRRTMFRAARQLAVGPWRRPSARS